MHFRFIQKIIYRIRFAKNSVYLFAVCFFGFQRVYSPVNGCLRHACKKKVFILQENGFNGIIWPGEKEAIICPTKEQ